MALCTVPGLEGDLVEVNSGGQGAWADIKGIKRYTNAFIVHEDKILLGYKKRGFGKGKYNGFGGKVDPGETPAQAASRELEEEAGIQAPLRHAGIFLFLSDAVELAFHIDIYRADEYSGVPVETDEMRPQWFFLPSTSNKTSSSGAGDDALPPIPFTQMWEGDSLWMPMLLSGQPFMGRADFAIDKSSGEERLGKWWFGAASPPVLTPGTSLRPDLVTCPSVPKADAT